MGDDRQRPTDEACDEMGGLVISVLSTYRCDEGVVSEVISLQSSIRVSGGRFSPPERPVRKRRWISRSWSIIGMENAMFSIVMWS